MARFRSARLAAGLVAASTVMLAAFCVPAAEPPGGSGPGQPNRRPEPKMLAVGQEAPDFELPRLVFETDKDGKTVGKIGEEKIKLSSLRGQKPVCLFLSSYT